MSVISEVLILAHRAIIIGSYVREVGGTLFDYLLGMPWLEGDFLREISC
jgi:hypothetical protein